MLSEFYVWLIAQAVLLAGLVFSTGARFKHPARLFAPAMWFVLFYSLVFFLPQCFMPAFGFPLIGAYNVVQTEALEGVLSTQRVLIVFLVAVALGWFGTARHSPRFARLAPLSARDARFGLLLVVIGGLATAAMIATLNLNAARSTIVASNLGKVLYALSFWFTLGYMILGAWCIRRKRWFTLLILTGIFAAALLPLGGRGRILWPLAGLVAWAAITGSAKIRFGKIACAAVILAVVLQALDPILLYYKGYDSADQAVARFQEGLELRTWLFGRNFDAFHNLAVIVNEDRIPNSPLYLVQGAQQAFMTTYFPSVAAAGVGYPATLPGGLFLAGRWVGVAGLGLFFGMLLGAVSRLYVRSRSELAVIVYCIAMPWIAHVGIAWLDSYLKMASLILPGMLLCWLLRRRTYRPAFTHALRA
ncbi:MAG: hypothetical protein AAFQ16_00385 [Pseudomonadota bacterium]